MLLTLRPLRRTFHVDFVDRFTPEQKSQLHFEFTPYDPRNRDSWRVVEIAKVIKQLAEKGVTVRPPAYMENLSPQDAPPLWESRITAVSEIVWSVIIPAYNSADTLPAVLKNLLAQNIPRENFEIIVVDDASEDNTSARLRQFVAPEMNRFNGCLLRIDEPHWKPDGKSIYRAGVARNLGFRFSRGEFVVFLDSDTITDPNFLRRYCELMKAHDLVQSVREYATLDEEGREPQNYAALAQTSRWLEDREYLEPFYKCAEWLAYPCPWKYVATYAMAVKRKHIEKLGLFRSTFTSYGFEDVELGYRWWKSGARFHLDKTPVFHLTPKNNQRRGFLNKIFRHYALCNSGKTLFHNTLDLEVFNELYPYMWGESRTLRWLYGQSPKT